MPIKNYGYDSSCTTGIYHIPCTEMLVICLHVPYTLYTPIHISLKIIQASLRARVNKTYCFPRAQSISVTK